MPGEMLLGFGESGLNLYALLTNAGAQIWNGATTAFENYQDGHWADYALSAAEQGSSGRYSADMPVGVPAGVYGWTMVEQQAIAPAVADSAWPAGSGEIQWDGAGEISLSSRLAAGSPVSLDMTQPVPVVNTPQTVGDALNAARAEGFGSWVQSGLTLTLMAPDGITPVHVFTLSDPVNPTSRN